MLPTVIASSVIRSSHQGQSHGGVYLVDLESGRHRQVIDWNDQSIDWEGRGADRGLRGIAFHNNLIYIAASDEVFFYTPDFKRAGSFKNPYLKHCHETFIAGDRLYLTSTGFDSILEYDLKSRRWVRGYALRYFTSAGPALLGRAAQRSEPGPLRMRFMTYDPNTQGGPPPGDTTHINSVFVENGVIYAAGLRLRELTALKEGAGPSPWSLLPMGTHNARPFGPPGDHATICNFTEGGAVARLDATGNRTESFAIPTYDPALLTHSDLPQDHARQGFGRGLCLWQNNADTCAIAGSSPSTISIYRLASAGRPGELIKSINLTMDVRNAIHGLELWPFDGIGA